MTDAGRDDASRSPRDETVLRLARAVLARKADRPLRVAVDGRTASGKTTLADELAIQLNEIGRPTIRTSIDGFHRPRAERYRQGRASPRGYYEDARDLAAVRRLLLDPLGPGGDRHYRTACFDLERDRPIDQAPRSAHADDVLIVEGTFLQRPALDGAWDFVVFVEVAEATALERGARRDADALGGLEAARRLHRARYQAAYALYASECDPLASADARLVNDDLTAPRLILSGLGEPPEA